MPYKKPHSAEANKKIAAKQARYHEHHKKEEGYQERVKEKNAVSETIIFKYFPTISIVGLGLRH